VAQGYDVNQPDDRGDTPIHYLFVHHHYELIPDLIKLGANVEEPDSVGKAVLHKVCELDFEVIIDTKKKTWKPAQVGIKHQLGHDEVRLIEVLIGTKPDLDAPDRRGHLPILQASKTGLVHQLAVAGANLNVQDKDGMTPLHFACAKGSLDRVKILCSLSADVTAQDKRGRTPLLTFAAREHFSVAGEDDDIVKIKAIIRAIENVNKLALTAKDNEGNGAWQLAARAQNKQFINALMDKGTAINTKDQNGRTILHGAVAACQHDFVKFLIETCRAEVNMQDNLGRTPLFLLCENRKANRAERQKMARYLQAMGASDKIGTVKCVKTPEGLVANKAGKSYGPNLKELFKEIAPPAKKEEEKKDPKAPGKKAVKPPIIIPGYENAKTVPLPPADDSDHEEAEVAEVAGEKNDGKTAV
jgi:ankyrin repeat protein